MHDLNNNRIEPGWYYRLSRFFKDIFSEPVYKIPLDAGFSCPNRDGTIGSEGCSYCYNPSFAPFSNREKPLSLKEQLEKGKKKSGPAKYLAYFQAYTNTYAPAEKLKILYDQALSDPEVIGLSIATRPDCVTDEVLELLKNYAARFHLWVEYGLQSANDLTLKRINRGHDAASFARAVEKTKNKGIYICAHIILGLPGETGDMIFKTIDLLNKCGVDGVKFHHLQVISHTALEKEFRAGAINLFDTAADYIPVLCDCLERLSPKMVIHRLASQATSKELLIAPHWPEGSGQIASMVENELRQRGSYQGCKFR